MIAPADKAGNNMIFMCKHWYIQSMVDELQLQQQSQGDSTYKMVDLDREQLLQNQTDMVKDNGLKCSNEKINLPTIYGLPKMHKAILKLRYIAASCSSPLKPIDLAITQCLGHIYKFMTNYCKAIANYTGTNRRWILDNSIQFKGFPRGSIHGDLW